MKDKTNILVAGMVALLVALGVGYFTPAKVINNQIAVPSEKVGSNSDFSARYASWGGIRNWAQGANLNGDAASTTICVIQAPQVASSSLRYFGVRLDAGTTTANTLRVYKSKSQYLQTTQIAADAVSAGTAFTLIATSTLLDTKTATFAANDWIVVRQEITGNGTFSPTGSCGAQFVQI